jgi:hypothetical protein
MKLMKLQTAVMLTVKELLALGGFSAYEATTVIRNRVDKEYELSDCDKFCGVTMVNHADVREIIADLYENEIFAAKKTFSTNGFGESFTVFKPIPVSAPSAVVRDLEDSHCRKIVRCIFRNGKRTMRQIQSSLKVKGLTCERIAKFLDLKDKNKYSSKIVVTRENVL